MRHVHTLLEEAREGNLAEKDLKDVVQKIEASKPGDYTNLYVLLFILGEAGAIQFKSLIEKFLYYPSDYRISQLALQILCNYWGYTSSYLVELKKFLYPVDWDKIEDIRITALSIAGEYLRKTFNADILQSVISIFEDEKEIPLIRACAYQALNRIIGLEWDDILTTDDTINDDFELVTSKIDLTVIKKAHQLLKQNS